MERLAGREANYSERRETEVIKQNESCLSFMDNNLFITIKYLKRKIKMEVSYFLYLFVNRFQKKKKKKTRSEYAKEI